MLASGSKKVWYVSGFVNPHERVGNYQRAVVLDLLSKALDGGGI